MSGNPLRWYYIIVAPAYNKYDAKFDKWFNIMIDILVQLIF